MDQEIGHLMLYRRAYGEIDSYGSRLEAWRPLQASRVLPQGRPSGCRLLCLPDEILDGILEYFYEDRPSLAALALVNSDCNQLARSVQFADVCFDYSTPAQQLLARLDYELSHPGQSKDESRGPRATLGACIRHATLHSHPDHICSAFPRLRSVVLGPTHLYTEEFKEEAAAMARRMYCAYRSTLVRVLSRLPNLDAFCARDKVTADSDFFRVLLNPKLQHLELIGIPIANGFVLNQPWVPHQLPLRYLALSVEMKGSVDGEAEATDPGHRERGEGGEGGILTFYKSLLQRCSLTLESLQWAWNPYDQASTLWEENMETLPFPRLRRLKLDGPGKMDQSALYSLLRSPSLKEVALPMKLVNTPWGALEDVLEACGSQRDLKTLVLPIDFHADFDVNPGIELFLSKNSQIERLCIDEARPDIMEQRIVPTLTANGFSHLRSLALTWQVAPWVAEDFPPSYVAEIPEQSLSLIGTLASLEQLYLSAGAQIGSRHQWLVDHDVMRRNLQELKKLRKLVLSRDTYPVSPELDGPECYYTERNLRDLPAEFAMEGDPSPSTEEEDDSLWETRHKRRMMSEAISYGKKFPALDLVYCGQWLMRLGAPDGGGRRPAIPLNAERDSCWTFFQRTFAMGADSSRSFCMYHRFHD